MSNLFRSKAGQLLMALDGKERNRLREFLQSPYFNKSEKVTVLYDFLTDYLDTTAADREVSEAEVFKNVQGISNKRELAKTLNSILSLTQWFLSLEYQTDEFMQELGAANELKKRGLTKHYRFLMKRLYGQLPDNKASYRDYYYWHILEETELRGFDNKNKRVADNLTNQAIASLDMFYVAKRLYYTCEALNRSVIVSHPAGEDFFEELLPNFSAAFQNENKDLWLYTFYRIYKMLQEYQREASVNYFKEVTEIISLHSGAFDRLTVRGICMYLVNHCIQKVNQGNPQFLKEYFDVIKLMQQLNVLTDDQDKISHHRFKNCVTLGLRLNEVAWVEAFIKDYAPMLPETYREDYVHYALGYLAYKKRNHTEAARLLRQVFHVKDVYFGVAIRKLALKNLYESGTNGLDDEAEAMRKYLSRNRKVLSGQSGDLEKFVQYFKRLWKYSANKDKLARLMQEVEADSFVDKAWLKEQIQQKLS